MDIFDALTLVGGLALFLLGMNLMGDALEKKAGGRLKTILDVYKRQGFGRNGRDSVLLRDHGDGCGFCQRGCNDAPSGDLHHHGRKRGNYRHCMAFEPCRNRWVKLFHHPA